MSEKILTNRLKMDYKIERTNTENADFRNLEKRLDKELYEMYGEMQNNFSPHNIVKELKTILIHDVQGPIACGCLKFLSNDLAEVKRVFVSPENRCKGISKIVIKELETWAIDSNIKTLVLQTGIRQNAAINLYRAMGYNIIKNYGPYVGDANSVCMQKILYSIQ